LLINAYILEAVDFDFDQAKYDEAKDNLAVYPKFHVEPIRVKDDLRLTGSIDYVTARRREPGTGK
jgi:hypothetical protein